MVPGQEPSLHAAETLEGDVLKPMDAHSNVARLPFVAGDRLQFANEHLTVGQGKVSPCLVLGYFPAFPYHKFIRIGFDQVKRPVLVESEDFLSVGNHRPVVSEGLRADPLGFAVLHVDAGNSLLPEVHVAMSVDHDRTRHIAFLSILPFFTYGESARRLGQVEEERFHILTCVRRVDGLMSSFRWRRVQ